MAIEVLTLNPAEVLAGFTEQVRADRVRGWEIDADGDFTYWRGERYSRRGWFRPQLFGGRLVFGFIKLREREFSQDVYSLYHGEFASQLVAYCSSIRSVAITANPDKLYDKV
jgi:hypothetical protein